MAELLSQERLQPSLLDRLIDDDRTSKVESSDRRVMSKSQLKQAVLRDLQWLLNTVRPGKAAFVGNDHAAQSVLNYGLPALAGETASSMGHVDVEDAVREAIKLFEPRIDASTVDVRVILAGSVLDTHNVLELQVRGSLWAQPTPIELILRTTLDLETGQVGVTEGSSKSR